MAQRLRVSPLIANSTGCARFLRSRIEDLFDEARHGAPRQDGEIIVHALETRASFTQYGALENGHPCVHRDA